MSTTDDLREALARHGDFHDGALPGRPGAVRSRVRTVRRRRRTATGAAAAVVAVIAGGAVLPGLLGEQDPRQFAGHTAPASMQSLGYTFDFVDGVEGDGSVSLRLPASDEPRLVSWASSAGEVTVKVPDDVDGDGTVPDRLPAGASDFADFRLVPAGVRETFRVEGEGDVALAVYSLAERAPGITGAGVTFREDVAGDELLVAGIGGTEVTAEFVMPDRALRIADFCHGVPDGHETNLSLNGEVVVFGSCGVTGSGYDGGSSVTTFPEGIGADREAIRPGDRVTARMWITAQNDEEPSPEAVELPGAQIGFAAYEVAPAVTSIGTWDLPQVVEHEGHRWEYVDSVVGDLATREVSMTARVDDAPLLMLSTVSEGGAGRLRTWLDGELRGIHVTNAGGGSQDRTAVFAEGDHTLRLSLGSDAVRPDTVLGISVYRRLDPGR